jgi:hypothetical protein
MIIDIMKREQVNHKVDKVQKIKENKSPIYLAEMGELNPGDYISEPRINYTHLAKVMEARRQTIGDFPNLFFNNLPVDGGKNDY